LRGCVEIVALLLLAGYLGHASLTGRVHAFLAASYAWLPPSAAALLVLMALARLGAVRGGAACDGHAHSSGFLRWLLTAALVMPIVAGLAIDPRQFSVQGVKRRFAPPAHDPRLERAMAWVLSPMAGPILDTSHDAARSPDATVLELIQAAEGPQAEALAGRFVSVIGQCDVANDPRSRRFGLYRFLVTCCIADARLVVLDVIAPPGVPLEARQWVQVRGVIRLDPLEADGQPVLHAATIAKIPPPPSPYL
jgi:uncharacterized repeat protein (TIGR03943 family)